ncbi:MAG TPA: energy transducer TonB [Acidobacteriaceae bacterium]|jgi:TonB family protein|nr:energy transducer TonB [Acidobacteriaceae bacterium]
MPTIPPGTNLSDAHALFPLAVSANSLDQPGLTPWHLKAAYESFDENGTLTEQGTFEEWRLSPDKWKRAYTSAKFNQTEYESAEGTSYDTDAGGPPWPLSLIGKELVHPMPDSSDTEGSTPELRPFNATKTVKLSCLMLTQSLKKTPWPLGLFPTYCFTANSRMLRFELFDGGVEAVRNQIAVFHGAYLAKDISVSDQGKSLLRIQLLDLSSMNQSEATALNAASGFAKIAPPKQVDVASGVISGNKIGGPNPIYPDRAKQAHIQGKVVMQARIGTDGRIHQLRVVSSTDDLLSIAAVSAVERWVYKPYMLQSKPVSVKTTINVIFTLGP